MTDSPVKPVSFLARIHGPAVELAGFLWAAGMNCLIIKSHPWHAFGIAICFLVYLASRDLPSLFKWIKGFAEIQWVSFVSVAVCALVAAHVGGWHAIGIIAGLAAMCDGRLFDYLY